MSMKAFVTNIDNTQNEVIVDGTIQLTGSYVTDGDTLDLSQLGVPATSLPLEFWAWSVVSQGAAMLFDTYAYIPGTALSNGKLQIGVAGSEMAATAYATTTPTNATGYALRFRAEFAQRGV